tara:strand:- start:2238 stop:2612 length:375 start_codon:yes stop_codon:yes gene_type:complete
MVDEFPALATPGRWLRNKRDGTIYGWTQVLANNPLVEEVTEEVAFPEKFIPKTQKTRASDLKLATDEDSVEEAVAAPKKKTKAKVAVEVEATQKTPKKRARTTKGHYVSDNPATSQNEAWENDS